MKKILTLLFTLALILLIGTVVSIFFPPAPVHAQHTPNYIPDPCSSQFTAKNTKAINISSAATTELVPAVAGKSVYVCNFGVNILGLVTTAGTFQLESGTKSSTACDTVPVAMTGAVPGATTAGVVDWVWGGSIAPTPVANELCAVTTGASPGFQGFVTFVQQ